MSYVFWRVPSSIKLRPKKRYSHLAIGWNVWGFHELGLFWQVHRSNYNWKKGTVVWPSVAMSDCFGRFVAMFLAGSLIKLQIMTGKKGTVIWPLVGMSHLKHASPWWSRSLAQAAWPWVISQCPRGTLFARGCPRAGCKVFC